MSKKDYYVYRRYGRTGTAGQAQLEGPFKLAEATELFEKVRRVVQGCTTRVAAAVS